MTAHIQQMWTFSSDFLKSETLSPPEPLFSIYWLSRYPTEGTLLHGKTSRTEYRSSPLTFHRSPKAWPVQQQYTSSRKISVPHQFCRKMLTFYNFISVIKVHLYAWNCSVADLCFNSWILFLFVTELYWLDLLYRVGLNLETDPFQCMRCNIQTDMTASYTHTLVSLSKIIFWHYKPLNI